MSIRLLKLKRFLRLMDKKEFKERLSIERIRQSDFFDESWYLSQNPNIDGTVDVARHYYKYGWKEGQNPSRIFDTKQYFELYPDVLNKGICPLANLLIRTRKKKFPKFDVIRFPKKTKSIERRFLPLIPTARTAVFAAFMIDGCISDSVVHYLRELKKVIGNIIFVADCPIFPQEAEKIKDIVSYCLCQRHRGGLFGSYKLGYLYVKDKGLLSSTRSLVFCNDRGIGPFFPLEEMFDEMSGRNVDYWGLTTLQSKQTAYAQHYLLTVRPKVFQSTVFSDFILSIEREMDERDDFFKYEAGLFRVLKNHGFSYGGYIAHQDKSHLYPFNMVTDMMTLPITMLSHRCPIIPLNSLQNQGLNFEGVEKTYHYIQENHQDMLPFIPEKPQISPNANFSIILYTFNHKELMDKAIVSCLQQTYQNFELIIVDDGSVDETEEYIRLRYTSELKSGKIRYFYRKKSGRCKSLNFALKQAKNNWIAYLDTENELYPYFLESYALALEQDKKTYYGRLKSEKFGFLIGDKCDCQDIANHCDIHLNTFVHHRSLCRKLGMFSEKGFLSIEESLIVRYIENYPPVYLNFPTVLYNDKEII